MAEQKETVAKETAKKDTKKKYISKVVLIDGGNTFRPDEVVELSADKVKRLLEMGAIAEVE